MHLSVGFYSQHYDLCRRSFAGVVIPVFSARIARSLAQFSQSIKFEGIDVDITCCVAFMMSAFGEEGLHFVGRDQRKMTSRGKLPIHFPLRP